MHTLYKCTSMSDPKGGVLRESWLYYFWPSWRGIHIRLKAHAPAFSSATTMVCRLGDDILHPL